MFRSMMLLTVLGALAGCSSEKPEAPSSWTAVPETALSESQIRQKANAIAARDALFERLMARLSAVVQADGPAAAIAVCQSEASGIAETVGREKGVRIGRTSDKRRNPNNLPPDWAVELVSARPTEPTFLAHTDGRFAALLPIRLKAQCLTCHGSPESIPVPVREALASRYPHDQAIGYAEGDLRGWFWVEVTKEPTETGRK